MPKGQTMKHIAYQLYCSRNAPSLDVTLKMLAHAGYKAVEGYGGILDDVDALKRQLDAHGLIMPSCHMGIADIENDPAAAIATAKTLGLETVFAPYLMPEDRPVDAAGWAAFGKRLAEAGKQIQDAGFKFGWHNHDFEFAALDTGEFPIDLIAQADENLLLELDLGWVGRAGLNPVDWINKYSGRIAAAHIKDIAPAGECVDEDGWADVGQGTLDWPAIHGALKSTGVDHYVIEHDNPSDDARFAQRSLAAVLKF
jgi:sugar phosphate isomerase/epimerase